jgi:hypothetical protein
VASGRDHQGRSNLDGAHIDRRLPHRRNNFRRRLWLPSLVQAGLRGEVTLGEGRVPGQLADGAGREHEQLCATEREAAASKVPDETVPDRSPH